MLDVSQTRKNPASRSPVLLVTGFGPFENFSENPSGDIAERVDGRQIAGVRVVGQRVAVNWREAWATIHAAARAHQPQALLCLGVAPDSFIRLEILAKNLALPSVDAAGEKPEVAVWWRIIADAPPAYYTTLPLDWLRQRLNQRRDDLVAGGTLGSVVRAELWPDAGHYLCNHVFFQAMHYLGETVPYRGFVHVPRYPAAEGNVAGGRQEVQASGVFLVEELARWLSECLETGDEVTASGARTETRRDELGRG
jgi:pyroglutamyl-peptidase